MTPPTDFAAGAMLRVMARGMAALGVSLSDAAADAQALLRAAQQARVPLEHKRALLRAIAQQHGRTVLLQLGQGVDGAPNEPALQALALAANVPELITRWQRLERFLHTRHRVQIVQQADEHAVLQHVALRGEKPQAEEDALVLGVLVGLCRRVGCSSLRVRFVGERRWRYAQGVWQHRALPERTEGWELSWRHASAPAVAPLGTTSDAVQQVQTYLAVDLSRSWTLPAMAEATGRAPRSLQRSLAEAGTSFAHLLQAARAAAAGALLTESTHALSEIGYVCGYADQAHFTRAFKQQAGLTPLKYREQFAR